MEVTIPDRPQISGLVEITVTMDLAKPKGLFVDVRGALSTDLISDWKRSVAVGGSESLGRVWNGIRSS